jgi:hypothetical protein
MNSLIRNSYFKNTYCAVPIGSVRNNDCHMAVIRQSFLKYLTAPQRWEDNCYWLRICKGAAMTHFDILPPNSVGQPD